MKRLFLTTLLLVSLHGWLYAQKTEGTKLQLRQSVRVPFKAGQVDKYYLTLKAGQFASIKVNQESVGIGYSVIAPDDSVMEFADYNALYQAETITIRATKTGDYRIDIFWDYGKPQAGHYSIVWDKLEATGTTPAAIAEQLLQSWYTEDGPGGAILVVKDGQVIYKGTRGMANLEHKIPLSGNSVFDLASVSKQFTGFAIAMLIDKGLLSLDDDVRKFLPEVPDFGKTITVRHLIYHTSGLSNWDNLGNASGYKAEDIITLDMVMKMVASEQQLNFNPGDAFAYSNTGYNLLAKVVESVTGRSFADWSKENIFKPLGMNNTVIKDDHQSVIPGKVYCYRASQNGYKIIPDNYSVPGSTSVYSSVDDLLKWVNNFSSGSVGGKNVLEIIKAKGTLNNGQALGYAFGNFADDYKGVFKREHLGLVLGFRTAIARYPQQKLAVVYLANDGNDATYTRATQIADIFLTNIKNVAPKVNPLPDVNKYLAATNPFGPEKSSVDLKENEGVYFAPELNIAYTLKIIDGALTLVLPRLDNIYLHADKPDTFTTSFPVFERRIEFQRDQNKKINGFHLTGGERKIFFGKVSTL